MRGGCEGSGEGKSERWCKFACTERRYMYMYISYFFSLFLSLLSSLSSSSPPSSSSSSPPSFLQALSEALLQVRADLVETTQKTLEGQARWEQQDANVQQLVDKKTSELQVCDATKMFHQNVWGMFVCFV